MLVLTTSVTKYTKCMPAHGITPSIDTYIWVKDILLAKAVKALSPSYQDNLFLSSHGVDLILGGHDHLYYASKGVTSWDNYDPSQDVLGAENDNGDVLVAKSGTDFRDLSEIELELSEAIVGSVRRQVITAIRGKYH